MLQTGGYRLHTSGYSPNFGVRRGVDDGVPGSRLPGVAINLCKSQVKQGYILALVLSWK